LFDGSKSFDENEDPLDFFWDFGDKNFAQGEKVFHSFKEPGDYTITLKVSDGMEDSFSTFTLKILPSQNFSARKIAFHGEKEGKEGKEIEEKREKAKEIAEIPSKEKEIFEKPREKEVQKITKILKIEKSEKEKETTKESLQSKENETKEKEKENEKKQEQQIFSQNFPSLVFASLKETILGPKVFLFLIFSIFILTLFLVKKIKPQSK
jgi:PKD repeat protein